MVLRISTEKKESRECRNFVRLEDYQGFLLLLGISAQGWKIFLPTGLYIYIKVDGTPLWSCSPKNKACNIFGPGIKIHELYIYIKIVIFVSSYMQEIPNNLIRFVLKMNCFLFIEARLFLYISPFMNCGWRRWNPKNET